VSTYTYLNPMNALEPYKARKGDVYSYNSLSVYFILFYFILFYFILFYFICIFWFVFLSLGCNKLCKLFIASCSL